MVRRLALVVVGLGLMAVAGAAPVAATDNPLSIVAHAGYSDVVKQQRWMPLVIEVTNQGPAVEGSLEVQASQVAKGGPPSGPAVYAEPFAISTGSTKKVRLYLAGDSGGAVVRIIRGGSVLASQAVSYSRTATTLVGVLSDDSTALDDLATAHPGGSVDVVHLKQTDLPDLAQALRAFDLLAIDDFATDSLTPRQQTALADYVREGGALLVGAGASWRRTLAGLPAELLPMRIDGLAILGASSALGSAGGVQVATGTLTSGTPWLSEGTLPLLIERAAGSGLVTLAAFDWNTAPVRQASAEKALLRQVLVRGTLGSSDPSSYPAQSGPFGGQASASARSSAVLRALASLPALGLPSAWLTGALVLIYVLLVGPVNFLALRALRRRALAWVTLPLIAALAAAGAYGGAIALKGGSIQVNQLSVLHLDPGSERGYLETYTGVMAPTRGDYSARVGRGGALLSPIVPYGGYGFNEFAAGPGIRVEPDAGLVELPGMTAFTLRGFASERVSAAPALGGRLRLSGGKLVGTIENRSTVTFTDAVLVAGDSFQKLGRLSPGARLSLELDPGSFSAPGPPAFLRVYPNYSLGPRPQLPETELRSGETRTELLALVFGNGYKGMGAASGAPTLVAWTDQSFEPVTVNGGRPRSRVLTAVALKLPVEQAAAGALPSGLVSGRIVDLSGDVQPGPPGALVVANGTVVVEFKPALAPGARLSSPAIAVSTFMGKPQFGGGTASLQAEAWDWTASSWVEVALGGSGASNLPAAAVNPAGGEVRLRVQVANSSFAATGLSLQGTVE